MSKEPAVGDFDVGAIRPPCKGWVGPIFHCGLVWLIAIARFCWHDVFPSREDDDGKIPQLYWIKTYWQQCHPEGVDMTRAVNISRSFCWEQCFQNQKAFFFYDAVPHCVKKAQFFSRLSKQTIFFTSSVWLCILNPKTNCSLNENFL